MHFDPDAKSVFFKKAHNHRPSDDSSICRNALTINQLYVVPDAKSRSAVIVHKDEVAFTEDWICLPLKRGSIGASPVIKNVFRWESGDLSLVLIFSKGLLDVKLVDNVCTFKAIDGISAVEIHFSSQNEDRILSLIRNNHVIRKDYSSLIKFDLN